MATCRYLTAILACAAIASACQAAPADHGWRRTGLGTAFPAPEIVQPGLDPDIAGPVEAPPPPPELATPPRVQAICIDQDKQIRPLGDCDDDQ